MWRAIYVAPFGELADPLDPVGLAVAAEERGWDGFLGRGFPASPGAAVEDPRVGGRGVAAPAAGTTGAAVEGMFPGVPPPQTSPSPKCR